MKSVAEVNGQHQARPFDSLRVLANTIRLEGKGLSDEGAQGRAARRRLFYTPKVGYNVIGVYRPIFPKF